MTDSIDYRLYCVRIFVRDWERALRFYEETLGMSLVTRSDEWGWAEFRAGGARLAVERVAPDDPEGDTFVGRAAALSLEVDDIEAVHRTLVERGVSFRTPPTAQPWGGVLAHFVDPEGNTLTLLGSPRGSGSEQAESG